MELHRSQKDILSQIEDMPPDIAQQYLEDIKQSVARTERNVNRKLSGLEKARHYVAMTKDVNLAVNRCIANNSSADEIITVLQQHGHLYSDSVGRMYKLHADRIKRASRNHEIWRRMSVNEESPSALAAEYGLTRQSVHRIYNDMCENHPKTLFEGALVSQIHWLKKLIETGKI